MIQGLRIAYILTVLLLFCTHTFLAQSKSVPNELYVFGMKLYLSKDLQKELEKQIAQITKSKTYYQAKANRATMYFPIIERVLEEESVPQDFKYLAIQESSLQSDAVSPSNAVGYWQFKKEAAQEVGLTINHHMDERKHIVASTRGAAKYIKKNYLLMTNWLYALIAYNTGYGGAQQYIKTKYMGAQEMDIDASLHWYAIKFLAIKLAYEDQAGYGIPEYHLLEYSTNTRGKRLAEIAKTAGLPEDRIKEYNKWLHAHHIPDDKDYTVIIPVTYLEKDQIVARLGISAPSPLPQTAPVVAQTSPSASGQPTLDEVPLMTYMNGIKAIQARKNDNIATLAYSGNISIQKFRKYNDLETFEEIKPGKTYYLKPKKSKGSAVYHILQPGETLWDVAQRYGIKLSQLIKKNRIEKFEVLIPGRKIYLRDTRPKNQPPEIVPLPTTDPEPTPSVSLPPILPQATVPVSVPITAPKNSSESPPVGKTTSAKSETTSVVPASVLVKKQAVYPDSAFGMHTVQPGQTLFSISRHYKTPMDTLKAWNNIGPEGIRTNQVLIVQKNNYTLASGYDAVMVQQGQTLDDIARRFNISNDQILLWNQKNSETCLPGEWLKIKK